MRIASPREAGGANLHPALQMEVFANLSADEDAPDESHILWWRNITLHYRFVGTATVEINAVRTWPQEALDEFDDAER